MKKVLLSLILCMSCLSMFGDDPELIILSYGYTDDTPVVTTCYVDTSAFAPGVYIFRAIIGEQTRYLKIQL